VGRFTGLNLASLIRQIRAGIGSYDRSPVEKTLYIVSSKSGGTAEVNAYFDFFWSKSVEKLGHKAGEHFIAITDPGTSLEKSAAEKGFWHVFKADPMVGGRNSALTLFGLVPASLIGMDVERLLENAKTMADQCVPEVPFGANPGAMLGTILGSAWKEGKDKLTILTDKDWESFGSWMEQLIAESSGKNGKGIVPLAKEPIVDVKDYSTDRLFVYLRSDGSKDEFISKMRAVNQPVIEFTLNSAYDLASVSFMEIAIALPVSSAVNFLTTRRSG
jgi:glucose-6-phosphate isomerase